MYQYQEFIIETLTNMHVGSGEDQMGGVDNMIQRDPVKKIPVINSSSLKGSLRDFSREQKIDEPIIKKIFGEEYEGSDKNNVDDPEKKTTPGKARFLEARLLFLPLRASQKVYFQSTSFNILKEYFLDLKQFGRSGVEIDGMITWLKNNEKEENSGFYVFDRHSGLEIEEFSEGENSELTIDDDLKNYLINNHSFPFTNLAIFADGSFKDICEHRIPVIARNCIGADGISENLFYEEILPRLTRLCFRVGFEKSIEEEFNAFAKIMTDNIVQIGANASIGYGLVNISKMPPVGKSK
jgi:CRISPR-associated protein Cmr4